MRRWAIGVFFVLWAGLSSVRVVELGQAGETLATAASQVDAVAGKPGSYAVCWQAAGELGAGQTRKFGIVLDGRGPIPAPASPVTAVSDGNTTTVTSGGMELTYVKGHCGMLTGVKVGRVKVGARGDSLPWMSGSMTAARCIA